MTRRAIRSRQAGYSPQEMYELSMVNSRVTIVCVGNSTFVGQEADQREAAAFSQAGDAGLHRGSDADGLQRHVGAPAAGATHHLGGNVAPIGSQSFVGAQSARQIEFLLIEIDGDDSAAAGSSQRLHQEQADDARADNHGRIAEADAGAVDGMYGDGDRLDHRGVPKTQRIGQPIENVPRHGDVLGESTVAAALVARDAENLAAVAEVDLSAAAEPALSAVDRRVERHPLAFGPIGDVAAEPSDRAGGLVAHDDRRLSAAAAAVHAVHVAAADAAGGHLQQHVVRPNFRRRPLLHLKTVVGGQYEGFHGNLLLSPLHASRLSAGQ